MAVEIHVTEKFPYKGSISSLQEFVAQAEEHGLTEFTWSAYQGDQREPSELILTARKGQ